MLVINSPKRLDNLKRAHVDRLHNAILAGREDSVTVCQQLAPGGISMPAVSDTWLSEHDG